MENVTKKFHPKKSPEGNVYREKADSKKPAR